MVAIVTGVAALTITLIDRGERLRVDLSVSAGANMRDYSSEGFGLRVAVVNLGERATTIDGGDLYFDEKKLGQAEGFLDDPRVLDRRVADPSAVPENRREVDIFIGQDFIVTLPNSPLHPVDAVFCGC